MKIVARRTLVRVTGQYASFPSLCTRDGGFWLAFRCAPDHRSLRPGRLALDQVDHLDARSNIGLLALDGDGVPHGAPTMLPPAVATCDQDPNLLRLRDGRLLLTGFAYYPLPGSLAAPLIEQGALAMRLHEADIAFFLWGGYARHSDDDGATWSAHAFLPPDPEQPDIIPGVRAWHGGAVRGRAVELADGTIVQAVYGGRRATGIYASELFASSDRGASWRKRATIAFDPAGKAGFCESGLVQLGDGSLLALHRTTGLDGRIATSRSRDDGLTWDDPAVHRAVGHPVDACALADGRLLVVYGYRARPYGVRARLWDSTAGSFDEAPELVLAADAPSPDVGYPWAVPLADGGALVAFYCADQEGVRGIDAVRLR